jgi:hypothetical protein
MPSLQLGQPKKSTTDPDAIKANIAHNLVTQRGFEIVKAMIFCGEILDQKKQSLPHGKWLPWIRANLDFTERTAQYYLKLYEHRDEVLLERPQSLLGAIALFSDTQRITPGLLSGDEKILRRNLVTPVRVVRKRLGRLPIDPMHYESVNEILEELSDEVRKLSFILGGHPENE